MRENLQGKNKSSLSTMEKEQHAKKFAKSNRENKKRIFFLEYTALHVRKHQANMYYTYISTYKKPISRKNQHDVEHMCLK